MEPLGRFNPRRSLEVDPPFLFPTKAEYTGAPIAIRTNQAHWTRTRGEFHFNASWLPPESPNAVADANITTV